MEASAFARIVRRAEELCRVRGARLTDQRRKVLEILCGGDRPMGAYEILDAMRDLVPGAAPPTVYRALEFLRDQGLVHKLETLHAYVGCNHPEHPHSGQFLICAECGGVKELEDEGIAHSLGTAVAERGFKAKRRVVEVIGTCARCAHKPEAG